MSEQTAIDNPRSDLRQEELPAKSPEVIAREALLSPKSNLREIYQAEVEHPELLGNLGEFESARWSLNRARVLHQTGLVGFDGLRSFDVIGSLPPRDRESDLTDEKEVATEKLKETLESHLNLFSALTDPQSESYQLAEQRHIGFLLDSKTNLTKLAETIDDNFGEGASDLIVRRFGNWDNYFASLSKLSKTRSKYRNSDDADNYPGDLLGLRDRVASKEARLAAEDDAEALIFDSRNIDLPNTADAKGKLFTDAVEEHKILGANGFTNIAIDLIGDLYLFELNPAQEDPELGKIMKGITYTSIPPVFDRELISFYIERIAHQRGKEFAAKVHNLLVVNTFKLFDTLGIQSHEGEHAEWLSQVLAAEQTNINYANSLKPIPPERWLPRHLGDSSIPLPESITKENMDVVAAAKTATEALFLYADIETSRHHKFPLPDSGTAIEQIKHTFTRFRNPELRGIDTVNQVGALQEEDAEKRFFPIKIITNSGHIRIVKVPYGDVITESNDTQELRQAKSQVFTNLINTISELEDVDTSTGSETSHTTAHIYDALSVNPDLERDKIAAHKAGVLQKLEEVAFTVRFDRREEADLHQRQTNLLSDIRNKQRSANGNTFYVHSGDGPNQSLAPQVTWWVDHSQIDGTTAEFFQGKLYEALAATTSTEPEYLGPAEENRTEQYEANEIKLNGVLGPIPEQLGVPEEDAVKIQTLKLDLTSTSEDQNQSEPKSGVGKICHKLRTMIPRFTAKQEGPAKNSASFLEAAKVTPNTLALVTALYLLNLERASVQAITDQSHVAGEGRIELFSVQNDEQREALIKLEAAIENYYSKLAAELFSEEEQDTLRDEVLEALLQTAAPWAKLSLKSKLPLPDVLFTLAGLMRGRKGKRRDRLTDKATMAAQRLFEFNNIFRKIVKVDVVMSSIDQGDLHNQASPTPNTTASNNGVPVRISYSADANNLGFVLETSTAAGNFTPPRGKKGINLEAEDVERLRAEFEERGRKFEKVLSHINQNFS